MLFWLILGVLLIWTAGVGVTLFLFEKDVGIAGSDEVIGALVIIWAWPLLLSWAFVRWVVKRFKF